LTFPATSELVCFPIFGKRLIPGRVELACFPFVGKRLIPGRVELACFPIVGKRLIPGRVQSTVHATFFSLFLNGEELEMNLFRHFVAVLCPALEQ